MIPVPTTPIVHVCYARVYDVPMKVGKRTLCFMEFHDWLGPHFYHKNGKPYRGKLNEADPVWKPFEAWMKTHKGVTP